MLFLLLWDSPAFSSILLVKNTKRSHAAAISRVPLISTNAFQLKLCLPRHQNLFSCQTLPVHLLISMQKSNKVLANRIQQHITGGTAQGPVAFIREEQRYVNFRSSVNLNHIDRAQEKSHLRSSQQILRKLLKNMSIYSSKNF